MFATFFLYLAGERQNMGHVRLLIFQESGHGEQCKGRSTRTSTLFVRMLKVVKEREQMIKRDIEELSGWQNNQEML
jgi:hypothetical protein